MVENPINYQRISREWRISERNGDIGNVVVSMKNTGLPATATGVLILVDDDGDFSA